MSHASEALKVILTAEEKAASEECDESTTSGLYYILSLSLSLKLPGYIRGGMEDADDDDDD